MIKLVSAIFTTGILVGLALAVHKRRKADGADKHDATLDHSSNNSGSDDGVAKPVTVPAAKP